MSENYQELKNIKDIITQRIEQEYISQTTAIRDENSKYLAEQQEFSKKVSELVNSLTCWDKVRVITQTGPNYTQLREYIGYVQKQVRYGTITHFNFVSIDRGNDMVPFTIAINCLQSIEILEKDYYKNDND